MASARNLRGTTMNNISVGLSLGTTSTYSTAASSQSSIGGKFSTALTAQTNAASPAVDAGTGLAFVPLSANQATVLVWGVTLAGAIQLTQGTIVPTATGVGTAAGAFLNAPQFPALPDNFCPLAYTLVRTSPTGNAFTAGVTSWTASGITTATQNLCNLPDRPQIV